MIGSTTGFDAVGYFAQINVLGASSLSVGSPTIDSPSAVGIVGGSPSAMSISTGSPSIGFPNLVGIIQMNSVGISVGSPSIGRPSMSAANAHATGLVVGSPVVGLPLPTMKPINFLLALGINIRSVEIDFAAVNYGQQQPLRLVAFSVVVGRPFFGVPTGPVRDITALGVSVDSPTIDAPLFQIGDPLNPGILADAGSQLIYRQATGLEKAMADVDGYRLTQTYAELIRDQWNPYAINYRNLAYLAWATGVNLWEDDWDEAFRRYWTANQWTFKSQRGSLFGIANFLEAAGSNRQTCPYGISVVSAIVPPAKFFPGRSDTAADRAAYLTRFPQLRLYPYVARALLPYNCFSGNFPLIETAPPTKQHNFNGSFLGPVRKFYPTDSGAGGRYTRTAVYWDRGVSTTLTFRTFIDNNSTYGATIYDQVTVPARKDNHWFLDQENKWPLPKQHSFSQNIYSIFLGAEDATASRQVLIPRNGKLELSLAQAQYQTIKASMTMIDVLPNHIPEIHSTSPWSLYLGNAVVGIPAKGSINFSDIPSVGSTMTIGTQVLRFIANGVVPTAPHQIPLGTNLTLTIEVVLAYLKTQGNDPNIGLCNYNAIGNSSGITGISVTSKSVGIGMNAFNLATNDPAGTVVPMYGGAQPPQGKSKQYLYKKFLPPSVAWQHIYEQWFLFDPSRVPDYRKASVYLGHARLGIQRYTAEIKVAAFSKWKPWFFIPNNFLGTYLRPANLDMINKVRRAVTASMAVRDTVRINTKIRRIINVNDSLPLDGTFFVGEYIND